MKKAFLIVTAIGIMAASSAFAEGTGQSSEADCAKIASQDNTEADRSPQADDANKTDAIITEPVKKIAE